MQASFDPRRLLNREFRPQRHEYSQRDVQLYALALGIGQDPVDEKQLRFVYEGADGTHLKVLPTFANVLAYPGFWAREPDTGIDWRKLVHAEQEFVLHRELPSKGSVTGRNRVTAIWDRGAGRGSFLQQRREVVDAQTGEPLATITQLSLLRGNEGTTGGSEGAPPAPHPIPSRAADQVFDMKVPAQAALLYRLSGDLNPLHADPAVARAAGFDRPILHGMATMGIAAYAVVSGILGNETSRFAGMRVRFTAPAYPGELLRNELWIDGNVVSLRTTAPERGATVIDNARVDLK
jgi:acyl dehydratase